MREKTDEKCYKSTPAKDLEDRIMNSNIAKSEAEWWAKGEIERLRERLALIAPELAKAKKYDELYSAASNVMGCLDTFGAKIVPHLMDTDDNPGQRLRDALNQPDEVSP